MLLKPPSMREGDHRQMVEGVPSTIIKIAISRPLRCALSYLLLAHFWWAWVRKRRNTALLLKPSLVREGGPHRGSPK